MQRLLFLRSHCGKVLSSSKSMKLLDQVEPDASLEKELENSEKQFKMNREKFY